MQNQVYIARVDRRKIARLLIDQVPLSEVIDMSPAEVTDEMIAERIHPKQKLDVVLLFGRPIHVTEEDNTLDLRHYLDFVGPNPEKVMRELGEAIRKLTGMQLM